MQNDQWQVNQHLPLYDRVFPTDHNKCTETYREASDFSLAVSEPEYSGVVLTYILRLCHARQVRRCLNHLLNQFNLLMMTYCLTHLEYQRIRVRPSVQVWPRNELTPFDTLPALNAVGCSSPPDGWDGQTVGRPVSCVYQSRVSGQSVHIAG